MNPHQPDEISDCSRYVIFKLIYCTWVLEEGDMRLENRCKWIVGWGTGVHWLWTTVKVCAEKGGVWMRTYVRGKSSPVF